MTLTVNEKANVLNIFKRAIAEEKSNAIEFPDLRHVYLGDALALSEALTEIIMHNYSEDVVFGLMNTMDTDVRDLIYTEIWHTYNGDWAKLFDR